MTRQLAEHVVSKIIQWEGEVLFAYDDFNPRVPVKPGDKIHGTLTIGVGHTGPDVFPGKRIDREESRRLFKQDIQRFCRAVERLVKVPLTDNQFGALVSFAFNVGEGAFAKSTLLKKLNAGDYDSVPSELRKWTRSKGQVLTGLVNRRAAEIGLWAKGEFVSSANVTPDRPKASPSARIGATGTAIAGTGVSGAAVVKEARDQLDGFADFAYIQYILLGLALVGLALTGYAAYKRWKDSQA